jgi:hypothetical protein
MRKTLTALAPLALVAGLLTGCGGSSSEDSAYCTDLKSAKTKFESFSSGDVAQLGDAFSTMHDLAAEAPDEVADDWKVIDDGITAMKDALAEAGLGLDDLTALQKGEIPDGVDVSKLQDLAPKLQEFGGDDMTKASEAIDKNAQDACGFKLSSS